MNAMKTFSLLQVYPCGWQSGNRPIGNDFECIVKPEAVLHFQQKYPQLNLNSDGYSKLGDISYCLAEVLQIP